MTKAHDEVIQKLCNSLQKQENVIGIVLFGSLANGTSHNYSDIDLFVVGHNEIHRTECSNVDGIQVQMIWRTPILFKEKIMVRTRTYPIGNSCKVLYDLTGEISETVENSKHQFELGPVKLKQHEIICKLADLSLEHRTIKGLIEQGRTASAVCLINELVMSGIDLYYDANNHYLVSPKHMINDLKDKNYDLGMQVEDIILEPSIEVKVTKFFEFNTEILEMFGGEINKYELTWS